METLRAISLILALLTAACYSYQVVYTILSLFIRPKPKSQVPAPPRRYALLIAARNEEAVLPHLLESIRGQDYPPGYLTTYVIADNCTDSTAAVAAKHGARVCQRFSRTQVGKGYALHYLLEQLRSSGEWEEFDAFLVFDADNLLSPDYIRRINSLCVQGYDAFCGYRASKNFASNWLSSGYGLWYLHDCGHLNRARMALGLCCYASGTGFGFTRALLEQMDGWNFLTLTEDTEFRTWCATRGITIGYCHDAVLYDEQPTSLRTSVRQRTRWIQGSIQVSLRYAGDYLRGFCRGGRTAWCSFEAMTLSLWGYGFSVVSFLCRGIVTALDGGVPALLQMLLLSLLSAYCAMLIIGGVTLVTERGRYRAAPSQKLRALLAFPIYMLSFLPIALLAFFRKAEWKPVSHTVAIPLHQLLEP